MRPTTATTKTKYRSVKYKLSRSKTSQFDCFDEGQSYIIIGNQTRHQTQRNCRSAKVHRSQAKTQSNVIEDCKVRKSTYIDSFRDLLVMDENQMKNKPKNKKNIRVYLPTINQTDSYFTTLDNVHLPINYITQSIEKTLIQLEQSSNQILDIKDTLKHLPGKIDQQISQIEDLGKKGIAKLQGIIHKIKVSNQEDKVNIKQSFTDAKAFLPPYKKELEIAKKNCQSLQDKIFASQPFELRCQIQHFDYF